MLPFLSGMVAALLGLLLFNAFSPNTQLTEREVRDVVGSVMASATPRTPNAVQAFENVKYSIVVIEVESEDGDGFGTGVIIDEFGDILTSYHVIAESSSISITFSDGTKSDAVVLSATPEQDIAILRAINMPGIIFPATLGNPGSVRVGDEVFVVGHPFGLTHSLSAGVVSGFDRSFQPSESEIRLEGLIQFDAAANPGNSGGPLLDQYGRVIGIVTGIIGPRNENSFAGIGFAVPITTAVTGGGSPPY
ncbi:MAG: trypsin-like peptidase domain-containing protein [Anaerolineales bacterium]|nr:trypsin-like peptidase domain-containing protein [Anaerolineales bacterium]